MGQVVKALSELAAWYRSDQSHIADEFYVPCLTACDGYDRASGYFTSSVLPILAQGLEQFIEHAGRMRMVCSPMLEEKDAEAIRTGYLAREEVVARALIREIESGGVRYGEPAAVVAWMVAEGVLDIRVAVPRDGEGIYHEKFGIFSQQGEDVVAFIGSPNETVGGVLANFEQIAVFSVMHGGREASRVGDLRSNFEALWGNQTERLEVIAFPEAAKRALLRYRPERRPGPRVPPRDLEIALFPHQRAAIVAWGESGHRGILEMATGTGKTLTALAATRPAAREGRVVVVLVPGLDLLEQWMAVLRRMIPRAAILGCSGRIDWPAQLSGFLARWRILHARPHLSREYDTHYVVATMDTAASERFQTLLRRVGDSMVLIVDEVHRAGAPVRRCALELPGTWRLGLSATPERPFDSQGEEAIRDGVGPVCFTYGIEDAIRDGYLCQYDYDPRIVSLTEVERQEYNDLSQRIERQFSILAAQHPQAAGSLMHLLEVANPREAWALQTLLFQRADVLKTASGKLNLVRELALNADVANCLVYCNDEEQVSDVVAVLRECSRSYGVFTTARLAGSERSAVLRDFALGQFDFLVSIRCLDEGIDIPGAAHAVILASSKTEREFIQRRGRVLRLAVGKARAMIHDPVVVPCKLDGDGLPMSAIPQSEQAIMTWELKRARILASAARNSLEALEILHKVHNLLRMG